MAAVVSSVPEISSIQELLVSYLSNGTSEEDLVSLGFKREDIQSAGRKIQDRIVVLDSEDEPGAPVRQMENSSVSNQNNPIQIGEKAEYPIVVQPGPNRVQVMPPFSEPLARAARQGNISEMEKLLQHPGTSINSPDMNGISLLANALLNAKSNAVRFISKNPDYKITPIDIEEVAGLMEEVVKPILHTAQSAQATLDAFLESITLDRLQHLDINSIKSIFDKKPRLNR